MNRIQAFLIAATVTTLVACGGNNDWVPELDVDTDVLTDVTTDTAVDPAVDPTEDSTEDTMEDAPMDSMEDTMEDAPMDSMEDTASDAPLDGADGSDADPCGNGTPDPGEECDDGILDGSYGGCNDDCTLASHCGDSTPDAGEEECDDGVLDGSYDGCNDDCTLASHCGDGTPDAGHEDCDDSGASATCTATCEFWASEVGMCDDGVDNDGDGPFDCADTDCDADPLCIPPFDILLQFTECGGGADHATAALTNLGLIGGVTTVTGETDLVTELTSGTVWDLVIIDAYDGGGSTSAMDELRDYYDAGGRIIAAWWNVSSFSSHDILDRAGVSYISEYDAVIPVYSWITDPLFSSPNAVPTLDTLDDLCWNDGHRVEPTTATAHAGYTATSTTNEAAITIDSNNRFIMNSFMPQAVDQDADSDTVNDMVELYENEISDLLAPSTLVWFEDCGSTTDFITPALISLGYFGGATFVFSDADLLTAMATGSYDLVIIEKYGNGTDEAVADALADHHDAGGGVILHLWDLDASWGTTFIDRIGVTVGSGFTTPEDVYAWVSDPMFTTPNAVPDLLTWVDGCGTDGQYITTTTGTAVAGFTATETAGQAGITVSPDGKLILNSFTPQNSDQDSDGDTVADMAELYANEIESVL